MKVLLLAGVGMVALLLAVMAGGITDAVTDFRTDSLTETFDGETGVGESSVNVQLSSTLWNASLSNASVSSNVTADAPSMSSYNGTNRQVTIAGLVASTPRTLTVEYRTAGLEDMAGADEISTNIPTLILMFIILIPASGLLALIVWAVKRQWF